VGLRCSAVREAREYIYPLEDSEKSARETAG